MSSFALSDAEGNTSRPLNRVGTADLPLLRTLLSICQKSWSPGFWEVINSCFNSICMFGSFNNPFTTITSLSELYFRFRRFILFAQMKKSDFYELWQQYKLLKTMEMSEVWPNTYNEGYIHQFQFEPTLLWNISQMTRKTIPISTRIVVSFAMKQGISFWVCW